MNIGRKDVYMLKNSRKKILALGLGLVMILGLVGCSDSKVGPVASVDGREISSERFEKDYNLYKGIYTQQLGEEALDEEISEGVTVKEFIKQEVLNKLIMEDIILNDAKEKGIKVEDKDIEKTEKEYLENFGGEEKLNEYLKESGLSKEDYRNVIKNNLTFEKHKEKIEADYKISDEAREKFFKENKDGLTSAHVKQIVVEDEKKANEVLKALKDGASFEDTAVKESKHSESAVNGGDLGFINKGQLGQASKELEDAIFSLKLDEISKPIKTEAGYHIIKLVEKKDSLESLKEDIDKIMKEEAYTKAVEEIRDAAEVKVMEENLAKIDPSKKDPKKEDKKEEPKKSDEKKEEPKKSDKKEDKKDEKKDE